MKRICCLLAFVLLAAPWSGEALAQKDAWPSDVIEKMRQSLKLNDEQVRQVKPVIEEEFRQMQSIKAESLGAEGQKRRLAALEEETASQLELYLTKEQLAQWKKRGGKQGISRPAAPQPSLNGRRRSPGSGGAFSAARDEVLQSGSVNSIKGGIF